MSDLEILKDIFNRNPELPDWDEYYPPLADESLDDAWGAHRCYTLEYGKVVGLTLYGFKVVKTLAGLERLSNLRQLLFYQNPFNELPEGVFKLTNLVKLGVIETGLRYLPTQLSQLGKLRYLDLNSNRLKDFPPEITQFSDLEELLLSNNELNRLPSEISRLTKLKRLRLDGNQFNVPIEIYAKSPPEQIRYILNLQDQGATPLNEGKIILLGDGASGKTALVERLVENKFSGETEMTEGIDIKPWKLDDVTLNIWDFGGQEIMRAMHQFFMTPRTLYLLVATHRTDDSGTPVENWLRLIETFGGDSPIIVVISKCDQHDLNLDENRLQDDYPNIWKFVRTSARGKKEDFSDPVGFEELRKEIKAALTCDQLKHIKDLIPLNQLEVKKALVETQKENNYINLNQYYQICVEHKVTDNLEQLDLLRLLNDLGIAFNYGSKDNPANTNVLKPEWVTKGIYAIINNNQLFQQEGRVFLRDLKNILLPQEDYRGKHDVIMGLMEQFYLCFSLEKNKSWLVPDLLPKKQPYIGEQFSETLQLQYQYEFLPRSIMPQFITRMNRLAQQYWLHGVIIKKGNNAALINVNYEKNSASIFVGGKVNTRRDFLDEIRREFTVLNDNVKGKAPKMLVPLADMPEHSVSFNLLLQHERAGLKTILIEDVGERQVKPLLDGVVSQKDREPEFLKHLHELQKIKIKNQILELNEQLKTKRIKYQQIDEDANKHGKLWFRIYWIAVFIVVLIGIVVAFAYWDTYGERSAWAVGLLATLAVAAEFISVPKKFAEKLKEKKKQRLIIYSEFDKDAFFAAENRLKKLESSLKGLNEK